MTDEITSEHAEATYKKFYANNKITSAQDRKDVERAISFYKSIAVKKYDDYFKLARLQHLLQDYNAAISNYKSGIDSFLKCHPQLLNKSLAIRHDFDRVIREMKSAYMTAQKFSEAKNYFNSLAKNMNARTCLCIHIGLVELNIITGVSRKYIIKSIDDIITLIESNEVYCSKLTAAKNCLSLLEKLIDAELYQQVINIYKLSLQYKHKLLFHHKLLISYGYLKAGNKELAKLIAKDLIHSMTADDIEAMRPKRLSIFAILVRKLGLVDEVEQKLLSIGIPSTHEVFKLFDGDDAYKILASVSSYGSRRVSKQQFTMAEWTRRNGRQSVRRPLARNTQDIALPNNLVTLQDGLDAAKYFMQLVENKQGHTAVYGTLARFEFAGKETLPNDIDMTTDLSVSELLRIFAPFKPVECPYRNLVSIKYKGCEFSFYSDPNNFHLSDEKADNYGKPKAIVPLLHHNLFLVLKHVAGKSADAHRAGKHQRQSILVTYEGCAGVSEAIHEKRISLRADLGDDLSFLHNEPLWILRYLRDVVNGYQANEAINAKVKQCAHQSLRTLKPTQVLNQINKMITIGLSQELVTSAHQVGVLKDIFPGLNDLVEMLNSKKSQITSQFDKALYEKLYDFIIAKLAGFKNCTYKNSLYWNLILPTYAVMLLPESVMAKEGTFTTAKQDNKIVFGMVKEALSENWLFEKMPDESKKALIDYMMKVFSEFKQRLVDSDSLQVVQRSGVISQASGDMQQSGAGQVAKSIALHCDSEAPLPHGSQSLSFRGLTTGSS